MTERNKHNFRHHKLKRMCSGLKYPTLEKQNKILTVQPDLLATAPAFNEP